MKIRKILTKLAVIPVILGMSFTFIGCKKDEIGPEPVKPPQPSQQVDATPIKNFVKNVGTGYLVKNENFFFTEENEKALYKSETEEIFFDTKENFKLTLSADNKYHKTTMTSTDSQYFDMAENLKNMFKSLETAEFTQYSNNKYFGIF